MQTKKTVLFATVVCVLVALVMSQQVVQAKTLSSPSGGNGEARIEGFRSAQFGMTEKKVLKAIFKDFKISKSKMKRRVHPTEKTVSFNLHVNDLLPDSGPANLFYVFGFKTKRLIQVNVLWGRAATDQPNPQKVVDTANQLRTHFLSQRFQKESLAVNSQLPDGSVLVFRGIDGRGRMVVLLLVNPPAKEGQPVNQKINLRLSYIENPDSPDIFKIRDGDF